MEENTLEMDLKKAFKNVIFQYCGGYGALDGGYGALEVLDGYGGFDPPDG